MRRHPVSRLTDAEDTATHSVYRIYDHNDELLYVGCAEDVEHRIYMHQQTNVMLDAYWIQRGYARHTSEVVGTKAEAREVERRVIATEAPWFNRQHNPARWRKQGNEWVPIDPDAREALLTSIADQHDEGWGRPDPEFVKWMRGEPSTFGSFA